MKGVSTQLKRVLAVGLGLAVAGLAPLLARDFFLQEGSEITLKLRTSVDSRINQKGDRIICTVEEPVQIDNVEVIPVGTRVHGRLGEIQRPGRFGRPGRLVLTFENIEIPGAGNVPISGSLVDLYDPEEEELQKITRDLDLGEEGEVKGGGPRKLKRGASIGIGAGVGAATGGGIGAAAGAAAGAAVAFIWFKGEEVELPAGTGLVVRIDRGVAISVPDMPKAVGNGTRR
ncbi:MAG: hypothetical protein HYY26_06215 [Acidobacteria bacterium]|nr:hypothetical protein [Acidobacteriota bacterium]